MKWERNTQINAGIDFSFLNGRITTCSDMVSFDKAVFQEKGWEFYAEDKRWFELVRRDKVA